MCKFCRRSGNAISDYLPVIGNVADDSASAEIRDYGTARSELVIRIPVMDKRHQNRGIGALSIPIDYCPVCGRRLGRIPRDYSAFNDVLRIMNLYAKRKNRRRAYGKRKRIICLVASVATGKRHYGSKMMKTQYL